MSTPKKMALLALLLGVIGSVLGGLVLRGYFSFPAETDLRSVRVVVITEAAEITVLGEREADCLEVPSLADCVTVVRVEQPVGEPVRAELTGVVSEGIALLYWGCDEGPAVPNCTIGAGREDPLVCVSTSSIYDETAGQACAEIAGLSQPGESASTGTEVVTIVPVTPDGLPLPDYVVTDLSDEAILEDCRPAYSAVAPDLVSCLPYVWSAHACWVGEDRVTLLCGGASGKALNRHTVPYPLPPIEPLPESERLPLAIELIDGTHCTRRWGGPAPLLPGDLIAPYVCGEQGLLVHSVKDTLFDESEPFWTVQTTGPGLLRDAATLPPRQEVAFVYYAGRP